MHNLLSFLPPGITRGRGRHLLGIGTVLCLTGGCGEAVPPETHPPLVETAGDTLPVGTRYSREYVFVGRRNGQPYASVLTFTASPRGEQLQRSARGWLALGPEWDRFLDELWTTPAVGGVWRIIPRAGLHIVAGRAEEIEALDFRRGERILRLHPGQTVANWERRDEHRLSVRRGVLELAGQRQAGFVVESLLVEPPASPLRRQGATYDRAILTDGGQRLWVIADGAEGEGLKRFAWGIVGGAEYAWDRADLRWVHLRPEEQARRDVPVHWSLRVPEADLEGEVVSVGVDTELGPDRPGRRTVEMYHTVEGWITIGHQRVEVVGVVRHVQR
jgi:hypothetical protein